MPGRRVSHRRGRDPAGAGRRLRRPLGDRALIVAFDEREHAGREHLDPAYVEAYDRKASFDVGEDVALLQELGLGPATTLVDLGAGTGSLAAAAAPLAGRVVAVDPSPAMVARARARGGFETVEAGFLGYRHRGEAPQLVYSRNALHHLPDFWKAVALRRVARLLAPGGAFVLRDIAFAVEPDDLEPVLEAWLDSAAREPGEGWTRAELERHVRTEHSTFTWLLEPLLERAGLEVCRARVSESRVHVRYVCRT